MMKSMMKGTLAGLFVTLLFCSTFSAPVISNAKNEEKKADVKDKKAVPVSSAEKELESLAAQQTQSDHKIPAEKKSETPAFIKQAILKAKAAESSSLPVPPPAGQPDNTQQLQQLLNEVRNNFDVSPQTVAKYLLIDGDFEGFNRALDELVNSGVLTPAEVARFREEVSWHYDNLFRDLMQSQDPVSEQESAYVPYDEYPVADNGLEYDSYRPSAVDDYDRLMARIQLQSYLDKQASLDSLLRQLITDYYSRYGVDETYENYDPVANPNFDESLGYDMIPGVENPEQKAEAEALEQAAENMQIPAKKSAEKKAEKKDEEKKAEKKSEQKVEAKEEEKKRSKRD